MKYVDPEQMALGYWLRMRRGALKEIEVKLSQFKNASQGTVRYWLAVHGWLEKKTKFPERKALS